MKIKLLSLALILGTAFTLPLAAQADEDDERPERGVARISLINGDVTVKRGDSGDLTAAAINAPLVVQDRIFTGPSSRAELQFDHSNMIRMAANAEVRLAELSQRRYIVQLARGLVTFRVLRDQQADIELSTPSISLRPAKRGVYRVEVLEDGTTEVTVRAGEAEVYTPQGTERVRAGRTLIARGSSTNPEFRDGPSTPIDDWDNWNDRRDRELERSTSYRYMSTDIYGGEDLDNHGRWVTVPEYGNVWTPYATADWAPYREGRWSWIDWYGWTWISHDPWGWAPYHYGRWFNQPGYGWCWWPGGSGSRHWWRPALVGFFGWNSDGGFGGGVGFGFGRIGWTPLGPHERFRPWYGSRSYGGYRNNTYIDNSVRIVNNVNINNYRNARVRNGVSGADGSDFVGGRSNRIRSLGETDLRGASSIEGRVPMVPDRQSLRMADREVTARGSGNSDNARFFSRRQPAQVERASFDDQRRGMEQVARRTFGNSGAGSRGGGGAVGGGEGARSADSNGGWRRVGDAGRGTEGAGGSGGSVRGGGGEGARSADSNGGSRRVGDAGRGAEGVGSGGGSVRGGGGEASRSADGGGWRTFGDSGRRSSSGGEAVDPGARLSGGGEGTAARGSSSSDGGGWRRFGDPGSRGAGSSSRDRSSDTSTGTSSSSGRSSDNNSGWRRLDNSGGSRSNSASEGWGRGGRSEARTSGSDVQVSPPIVRDRSADYGGGSRRSEPRYEAPRSSGSDSGSAPAWSGGGRSGGDSGGGRRSSERSYEAPRSSGRDNGGGGDSGRSSAPAWSGGGGGGRSGGGDGGGRSSGGGGRIGGGDSGSGGGRSGGGDGGGGRSSGGGGGGRSGGDGGGRSGGGGGRGR